MSRRTRYQQESVRREKRQSGPDVWIFRWRETGPDGSGTQRKAIVGSVESLATDAAALKAAQALRIDANQQTPVAEGRPKTVAELIAHYRLKELAGEKQGRKAFRPVPVRILSPQHRSGQVSRSRRMARQRQAGQRYESEDSNIMSAIFHHAMRSEWVDRNPIKLYVKAPNGRELLKCSNSLNSNFFL